jgi:hypothetical protein
MPRQLKIASLTSMAVFLLAFALVAAVAFWGGLPHPWLWMAGAGMLICVVGGPLGVRSYARAYERWTAQQP